jgi:EAL domain-containing protein (putative c-di-GMP-specific phosphodiesterase class I)
MGVNVVLDDFGTGYSSLAYLNRFPVDGLKIDRSFIDALSEGSDAKRLVQAIIDIAHSLEISVTAEGIETAEQLALLKTLACEYGQGYFFSKPMGHSAIEQLLERAPTW